MQKWEYARAYFDIEQNKHVFDNKTFKSIMEMLNSLGKDGWELVSVTTWINTKQKGLSGFEKTNTTFEVFYFKRELH